MEIISDSLINIPALSCLLNLCVFFLETPSLTVKRTIAKNEVFFLKKTLWRYWIISTCTCVIAQKQFEVFVKLNLLLNDSYQKLLEQPGLITWRNMSVFREDTKTLCLLTTIILTLRSSNTFADGIKKTFYKLPDADFTPQVNPWASLPGPHDEFGWNAENLSISVFDCLFSEAFLFKVITLFKQTVNSFRFFPSHCLTDPAKTTTKQLGGFFEGGPNICCSLLPGFSRRGCAVF